MTPHKSSARNGLFGSRLRTIVWCIGLANVAMACRASAPDSDARTSPVQTTTVRYLEVVTEDVDSACSLYETMYGMSFAAADANMGGARIATRADGTLIGIRKPLAAHEKPIMRTYVAVEDIQTAVKAAEAKGAIIAYPPTEEGDYGTFSIVISGGVEHGLWQK